MNDTERNINGVNDMSFVESIYRPEFSQKYTTVYTTSEEKYGAHHHYIVTDTTKDQNILESINFQEGPIKENGLNGIFNEDLLLMIIDRLEGFQKTEWACYENANAIYHLYEAVASLRARTERRKDEGVIGTSEV